MECFVSTLAAIEESRSSSSRQRRLRLLPVVYISLFSDVHPYSSEIQLSLYVKNEWSEVKCFVRAKNWTENLLSFISETSGELFTSAKFVFGINLLASNFLKSLLSQLLDILSILFLLILGL